MRSDSGKRASVERIARADRIGHCDLLTRHEAVLRGGHRTRACGTFGQDHELWAA